MKLGIPGRVALGMLMCFLACGWSASTAAATRVEAAGSTVHVAVDVDGLQLALLAGAASPRYSVECLRDYDD